MTNSNKEKLIDKTLNSFDGMERAAPKPFLITRILAGLGKQADFRNTWTRLGIYVSRPAVAFAGIAILILINMAIILIAREHSTTVTAGQPASLYRDEFAINTVSIYDIETTEP